jgi:hypothetical protein
MRGTCAPVAQLDRASVYGTEGWEFESLRGRQSRSCCHSRYHVFGFKHSVSEVTFVIAVDPAHHNLPILLYRSRLQRAAGACVWARGVLAESRSQTVRLLPSPMQQAGGQMSNPICKDRRRQRLLPISVNCVARHPNNQTTSHNPQGWQHR